MAEQGDFLHIHLPSYIPYILQIASVQFPQQSLQAQQFVGQCRCHGTEGHQGAGSGLLYVCALLVAVLHTEHHLCRLPRVPGARACGEHLPLAGLCLLHDQSDHLHNLQSHISSGFHTPAEMQLRTVSRKGTERERVAGGGGRGVRGISSNLLLPWVT